MNAIVDMGRRLARDTRGAAALLLALAMPVVIGGFGLGTEVGVWYMTERKLQNAADVAAYAAATEVRAGRRDWARNAAMAAAQETGFAAERGEIDVRLDFGGNPDAVEVLVQETLPRMMSALFGRGPLTFEGRAVAEIDGGVPSCVLALDPANQGALTFHGGANAITNITGCNVHANSLHDDSIMVNGNPRVRTDCISTAGGIERSRNKLEGQCGRPRERTPVAADPFRNLTPPTDVLAQQCKAPAAYAASTLTPGRYCNALELKGNVTLERGIYVIENDVHINANGNITAPDGVMFYIRGEGRFIVNGTPTVRLNAYPDPPYKGVLLFADQPPGTARANHLINGNSTSYFNGALYAPRGSIGVRGNNTSPGQCTQVVADQISLGGSGDVKIDCTAANAEQIRTVRRITLRQ